MRSHPINLALRFVLELGALAAMGFWGWTQHDGVARWIWMIALPIAAAAVWGTFAVAKDPSRSGRAPVPIPGVLRLLLEFAFFAGAAVLLGLAGQVTLAIVFAGVVVVHYAISYDRVAWLVRN